MGQLPPGAPLVKVCGLTRHEDVQLAVSLGASLVGFVMAPGTPREVTAQRARELACGLPTPVAPVLVFREADFDEVRRASEVSGIRTVQLHGFTEGLATQLEAAGLRVRRVHSLAPGEGDAWAQGLPQLVPAASPTRPWHLDVGGGGTGLTFDWRALGPRAPAHVFVSGGIAPENIDALLAHRPWGIDLSSGVEREAGIKHAPSLEALFAALRGKAEGVA